MGIVTYAFGIHQRNQWAGRHQGLSAALALLEEAHQLGAAGIQTEIRAADAAQATELRRRAESYEMYIEASVTTPKSAAKSNDSTRMYRPRKGLAPRWLAPSSCRGRR
jgi:hypothetical protein